MKNVVLKYNRIQGNILNMTDEILEQTKIAIFKGRKIRKTIYKNEWWLSVIDIIEALTDSVNARDYWYRMKIRVKSEDGVELSTICRQLKLESLDGKKYSTDCANTEGIFSMNGVNCSLSMAHRR